MSGLFNLLGRPRPSLDLLSHPHPSQGLLGFPSKDLLPRDPTRGPSLDPLLFFTFSFSFSSFGSLVLHGPS